MWPGVTLMAVRLGRSSPLADSRSYCEILRLNTKSRRWWKSSQLFPLSLTLCLLSGFPLASLLHSPLGFGGSPPASLALLLWLLLQFFLWLPFWFPWGSWSRELHSLCFWGKTGGKSPLLVRLQSEPSTHKSRDRNKFHSAAHYFNKSN